MSSIESDIWSRAQDEANKLMDELGIDKARVIMPNTSTVVKDPLYQLRISPTNSDDEINITLVKIIAVRRIVTEKTLKVIDEDVDGNKDFKDDR